MEPAREVGGDYYDVLEAPGGGFRMVLGDVSGKGVPASLLMVMARAIVRSVGTASSPLDEILAEANDLLEAQVEDDTFVSLVLLEPDAGGRRVRACCAGHEPPLLYRRAEARVEALPADGVVLGAFRGVRRSLAERTWDLGEGDVLLCFSDGVTECRGPGEDMFGRDRLARTLGASARAGADAVVRAVLREVEAFRRGTERSDDITLLALEAR
jgi:sigma-B regulation protein RsbU (phosphoserine phosphatase)